MKTLAREVDRAEVLRRLRLVRPDSRRRWGRMTAHEMVCHLADSCRMALGRRMVSHASGVFERTIVKWLALYLPVRWRPGILTRPEIEQGLGGTCPGDFAADVVELEALLTSIATQERGLAWPVHPLFGRMSERAWLRWAYLHADHHLRQFGL